jgi:hypothetical protein
MAISRKSHFGTSDDVFAGHSAARVAVSTTGGPSLPGCVVVQGGVSALPKAHSAGSDTEAAMTGLESTGDSDEVDDPAKSAAEVVAEAIVIRLTTLPGHPVPGIR